ncbi:DUF4157 domain-containing protein [Danxiaibacter flavus]|uniref:DUF4157 domain-containing protein n=1 Tax=Danxiaibacter flavus TaxID=3049108 RepID=A0ABV3ZJ59_9BACT|nr:DUF4157 domain-containing protein [Chitinophagaceae bacterium DXS]
MNTRVSNEQRNDSSIAVANFVGQREHDNDVTQFADGSFEMAAQRQEHDSINMNAHAKQLKAFKDMANNSRPVKQLRVYQAMADQRNPPVVQPKERNTGLPDNLQSGIENLSGFSMNDVKVHYNSDKPARLNALAYAQGTDIHIGPGQEKHLPHEAWHVVQQKQGRVKPTMQMKGNMQINDDEGLEKEADAMGGKALHTVHSINDQDKILSNATAGSLDIAQRVRGGIEYTEHGGTELHQWQPSAVGGLAVHNAAPHAVSIVGSYVTFYAVPMGTYDVADADNGDYIALQAGLTRLENDVESAEWIIERHGHNYTKDNFILRVGQDWIGLWSRREALRQAIVAEQGLHAGSQIVFREGNSAAHLTQATAARVFDYDPRGTLGSVQITLGYKGSATIENIALSNVSKYLAGRSDDADIRRERVGGAGVGTRILDKLTTDNQWINARQLHTSLMADMTAVEPGIFSDIFTTSQLATVQLMVLMDTMARLATNDAGWGGQSSAKNIQRYFPKSARDSYVREMLGSDVSDLRIATIRARLNAAIAASTAKFFAALDAIKLPVGAFQEANPADVVAANLLHSIAGSTGATRTGHENSLKTVLLGTQPNFVATAQDIIKAYTDTTVNSQEQHRGNNVANGYEYLVSGKAPHIVARGNGAVFEDRDEVVVAGGDLGTWQEDNPVRMAIASLLRGAE